ncbi:MAG: hypothetical protein AAGA09_08145 [Pseudomonadota bacterium]
MTRKLASLAAALAFLAAPVAAQNASNPPAPKDDTAPICSLDTGPYRDLDFLVGDWEFFTLDGRKIADQTYHGREAGCLVLEDWQTLSGDTGTGMNFVDPFTGKWRQVWMSPRFHIDYSGGVSGDGVFTLEGRMFSNDAAGASAIRGVYTRQDDGSVTKEFLRRDDDTQDWKRFFIGVAYPRGAHPNSTAPAPGTSCTSGDGVYGAFAFLPGAYNYLDANGKKVGETVYSARAKGCVILEEFTDLSGATSVGTLMVDPKTGQWRHTWRSERFYFSMTGGKKKDGSIALEGDFHPSGGDARRIRGVWTADKDGSIAHRYETFEPSQNEWSQLFAGTSVPKASD